MQEDSKMNEGEGYEKELYDKSKANVPLKSIQEKWKLVPAFLRLRGLVKQHIDSFNYLINDEIKNIIKANELITSDALSGGIPSDDPANRFYFKFTDIRVGSPKLQEDCITKKIYPQECRIRDMTYSAQILIDVEYTKGN